MAAHAHANTINPDLINAGKPVARMSLATGLHKQKETAGNGYLRDSADIFFESSDRLTERLKAREIVCIEIGPTDLRLLHTRKIKDRYQIERWQEVILDKQPEQHIHMLKRAVKLFLNSQTNRRLKVVLSLSGPEVNIHTLDVPKLATKELKEAIYWKCKQEIPSFSDSCVWQFKVIGEIEKKSAAILKVLVVVAQEMFITKYLNILESIDVHPDQISVKPMALFDAFKLLTNDWAVRKKNIMLIDVSRTSTLLCFYRLGIPEFVRTLPIGTDLVDDALGQPLVLKDKKITLKPDKIDQFKRKYGIIFSLLQDPNKKHFPFSQLFHHMLPVLKNMISELRRSVVYFKNTLSVSHIDAVFVTGVGCNLKNFESYLARELNIPAFSFSPEFPQLRMGNFVGGYEYTSCFGAVSRLDKMFNFLPSAFIAKRLNQLRFKLAKIAALVFTLLVLLISFFLYETQSSYESRLAEAEQKYRPLYEAQMEQKKVIEKISLLQTRKRSLLLQFRSSNQIQNTLKVISHYTPKDIQLLSVNYMPVLEKKNEEKKVLLQLKGIVFENFAGADMSLINYITDLDKLPFYKEIVLKDKSKDMENQVLHFELQLEML